MTLKVAVSGANGRMGREVVRLIDREPMLELVAAVSATRAGQKVREVVGVGPSSLVFSSDLEKALSSCSCDVMVDFTTHEVVQRHIELSVQAGVCPVIGTSGLDQAIAKKWDQRCRQAKLGGIIVPNFSLGAVLMMVFAARAAKYLPHVEIIEAHHEKKSDAPSGTAIKISEMIAERRPSLQQGHPEEKEILPGARGGATEGFRIHSVRLPGFFSRHEVLCAAEGQVLTLQHDASGPAAFMPGVKIAVEKVMDRPGMVYGLESLLDLS